MPTPAERKALIFLSLVIILGAGTRLYRSSRATRPMDERAAAALRGQMAAVDSSSARRRAGQSRKGRPRHVAPPDPPAVAVMIDLDRAQAPEIETLRGIGPSLAARIAADRDSLGPFGSLEGFQRVRGVGPALAEKLAPHVTFSGVPRPVNTVVSRRSVKKSPKRKSRRRPEVY
jgi:competence protein ComEA